MLTYIFVNFDNITFSITLKFKDGQNLHNISVKGKSGFSLLPTYTRDEIKF